MNIKERLKFLKLSFEVGVKWRDLEYLGMALAQCVKLAKDWKDMLLVETLSQTNSRASTLLIDPKKQLEWIKILEVIGTDIQKAVNFLDFKQAELVAYRFQKLFSEIENGE